MWGYFTVLPAFAVMLSLFSIILQLTTLPSSYWGFFTAKIDLGKPVENGHYGMWGICSNKAPHWVEDCDPLDTFFQLPTYAGAAGAVSIIHLLLLFVFLPLSIIRLAQVVRGTPHFAIKVKRLGFFKVSAAFVSVILDIVICTLASVGETRFKEYDIRKGWAFWIQIAELILDLLLSLSCAFENIQFWQLEALDGAHVDSTEDFSETYGNPTFDASSPRALRKAGAVYVTDASGYPYPGYPEPPDIDNNPVNGRLSSASKGRRSYDDNGHISAASQRRQQRSESDFAATDVRIKEGGATVITLGGDAALSYENPSFREQSPGGRRKKYSKS